MRRSPCQASTESGGVWQLFGILLCLLVPQDSCNNEQEGTSAVFDAIRHRRSGQQKIGGFLFGEGALPLLHHSTAVIAYEASGGYYRRVNTCTSCLTPTMIKGRNTISCAECLGT